MLINIDPISIPRSYLLPTILIVEDDEDTAEALHLFFQMTGYICLIQTKGSGFLALVEQVMPSLIIIDYLLPDSKGADLCNLLKNNINTRNIPVIMYSAYPQEFFSSETSGYDAFIAKPFDLDNMLQLVRKLLIRHRSLLSGPGCKKEPTS
jgi:DNA-binding response OmpR family regulator